MFVCFGNICRSPMAEFIFRHRAEKAGDFEATYRDLSAGTDALIASLLVEVDDETKDQQDR